jgi:hypothetical protein
MMVNKKKKMTQGWVVHGGMRHAEPQREMFSRSYDGKQQHKPSFLLIH